MKAIYIREFGDSKNLSVETVPDIEKPKDGDVLVKVSAAGINRADILQAKGIYPAPKGFPERIPGLEFAGVIECCGGNVEGYKLGERVCGLIGGGAQAEFVAVPAKQLLKIPDNLNFVEAAAIPEAFITAFDAIDSQANIQPEEKLLIHAVASGVGLAALQIAKLKGAKVVGTSRTASKFNACEEFKIDLFLDLSVQGEFVDSVKDFGGADVILDLVGAKYFQQNLECANSKARIMLVGLLAGRKAEFDLGLALTKRLEIIGTVLRSRDSLEMANVFSKFRENILPKFQTHKLRPNLNRVFSIEEVRNAYEYIEQGKNTGKVVLKF